LYHLADPAVKPFTAEALYTADRGKQSNQFNIVLEALQSDGFDDYRGKIREGRLRIHRI